MGSFESASVSLWLRENSIETEQSGEPERDERRAFASLIDANSPPGYLKCYPDRNYDHN